MVDPENYLPRHSGFHPNHSEIVNKILGFLSRTCIDKEEVAFRRRQSIAGGKHYNR